MAEDTHDSETVVPVSTYLLVYAALVALTVLTTAAAFVELGRLHLFVALVIAVTKALLVVLFFMHLRWSGPILQLAGVVGLIWLSVLILLSLSDFLTRPGQSALGM